MALTCETCGNSRHLTEKSEYEAIRLGKKRCHKCARKIGPQRRSKYVSEFPIGRQFGRWCVTGALEASGAQVECTCSCGSVKKVKINKLLSGKTTQCRLCSRGDKSPHWRGVGELPATSFTTIKLRARARDIEFNLTKEYLAELYHTQKGKCAISGIAIDFLPKTGRNLGNSNGTASLDRIDSNLGYVQENVWWVHKHVNIMKNEYDMNYFLNLCRTIVRYND